MANFLEQYYNKGEPSTPPKTLSERAPKPAKPANRDTVRFDGAEWERGAGPMQVLEGFILNSATSLNEKTDGALGATAQVAADEFAFGTSRLINAGVLGGAAGLYDLATGYRPIREKGAFKGTPSDPYETVIEAMKRAYSAEDERLDEARETAGPWGNLIGGLLGNLSPYSPARAIDSALDAGRSLGDIARGTKSLGSLLRTSTAVGGTTAGLQSALQGDSAVEVMLNGTLGAVMGGTLQKILGDNAIPMMTRMGPEGALVNGITETGLGNAANLNLPALADAIDAGRLTADDILTAQIGNAPRYRQWARVNDTIADYVYGGLKPEDLTPQQIRAGEDYFAQIRKTVDNAIMAVNAEARDLLGMALGNPKGRQAALATNDAELAAARALYRKLGGTNEGMLGGTPFNPQELLDRIDRALLESLDRGETGQIKDVDQALMKARNAFKDLIRGREVAEVAQTVRNIPSEGAGAPQAEDILPPKLELFRLVDAYSSLSDLASPQYGRDTGFSNKSIRGIKIIQKEIANYLDGVTENKFGIAKGKFSEAMRRENLYDLGTKIYTQRHIEVPETADFSLNEYYGTYVTEMLEQMPPEDRAFVQAGFKQAMFDQTGRRGFNREMLNFIGEPGADRENFFKGKGENYRIMEMILGKDDTNKIMRMYDDSEMLDRMTDTLYDNLKELDANLLADLKKSGLDRTITEADPFEGVPGYYTLRALNNKIFKPSAAEKANAWAALMLGGEGAEEVLRKGVTQLKKPSTSVSSRVGGMSGAFADLFGESDAAERRAAQQEGREQEVQDYLRSLGVSPEN